jgi:hypothetical protein
MIVFIAAALLVFVALPATVYAASLRFTWTANPAEDQISGYRLYADCGSPACIIADIASPTTTTITIPGPTDKVSHAYSLTAYRRETDGSVTESGQSAYAIYQYKPSVVGPIKLNMERLP